MSASSPLPSYSSPASSRAAPSYARRPSFGRQLAFLVHSQESVANHMPPQVDNKALARQKRRRTRYVLPVLPIEFRPRRFCRLTRARAGTCSCWLARRAPLRLNYPATVASASIASALTTTACSKEDEDILKAEYLQNPRPDKAARLRIVRNVALGEKEVQVRTRIPSHVTSARIVLMHRRVLDLVSK